MLFNVKRARKKTFAPGWENSGIWKESFCLGLFSLSETTVVLFGYSLDYKLSVWTDSSYNSIHPSQAVCVMHEKSNTYEFGQF